MDGQTGFQNEGFQPPAATSSGFQDTGFSQTGFQQQFNVLLTDMNTLRQNLQSVQWQIQKATTVVQRVELAPGFSTDGSTDPTPQDHGFIPPGQEKVTLLQNDATALRNCINEAKLALDQAQAVVMKQDFGPGFWQGGQTVASPLAGIGQGRAVFCS